MDLETTKRLKKKELDPKLKELVEKLNGLLDRSRTDMKKFYMRWDRNNDAYMGKKPVDRRDLDSRDRGEPEQMVGPLAWAQVQTAVAFSYLLYTQNKTFFQLNPTGPEDYRMRYDSELTLERDFRRNKAPSKVYQQLVDYYRFGLGVTKEHFVTETKMVQSMTGGSGEGHGFSQGEVALVEEKVVFEGNRITNVSPYKFFPDTRRPMVDWALGEFAADEDEVSRAELKRLERAATPVCAGIEWLDDVDQKFMDNRKGSRLPNLEAALKSRSSSATKDLLVRTEVHIDLVPERYGLGPESFPVRFLIWLVNDKRPVRISRAGYMHLEFPYNVSEFTPDLHNSLVRSLADVIYPLQDVHSWLINSRIAGVTRGIEGKIIGHPGMIDSASLEHNMSPWVWTNKNAPIGIGVDKFFANIPYVDNTASHFQDAQILTGLVNMASGVNENAMGQFTSGRRSATEARSVNAGAAGRMKMAAATNWWDHYAPMGRKMLLNQRQGMSFETFQKIIGAAGEMGDPADPANDINERFAQFRPENPLDLVGNEDFFVFDSTLETEKGFIAQSLQELVIAMLGSPENAAAWQLDPKKMIEEIMELRGVGKISRFSFDLDPLQNESIQQALAEGAVRDAGPAPQLKAV
jgi:hypothetical protein